MSSIISEIRSNTASANDLKMSNNKDYTPGVTQDDVFTVLSGYLETEQNLLAA